MTTQIRCDGEHNAGDHEIAKGDGFYSIDTKETDGHVVEHKDYCLDSGKMVIMQLANLFDRGYIEFVAIQLVK